MHYYLYQITNLVNNKIYVGVHQTKSLEINDRYMGSGKVIKAAITKHGAHNFKKDILETFDTSEAMYAREKEVVTAEFLKREDVYNIQAGSHGGWAIYNRDSTLQRSKCARGNAKMKILRETDPEWQASKISRH